LREKVLFTPVLYKPSMAVLSRKCKSVKSQAELMPQEEWLFTLGVHDDTVNMSLLCLNYLGRALFRNGGPSRTSSGQDVILSGSDFLRWRRKAAVTTNLKTRGNHVT
jgi:hypothetical protein